MSSSSKTKTIGSGLALAIAAAAGAGLWLGLAVVTGRREAWDSAEYFSLGLPGLALVAGVLGFLSPKHAWRWGLVPMAAQAIVAVIQNPTANLLPLGLILFAVLSIPLIISAYVGVFLRKASSKT